MKIAVFEIITCAGGGGLLSNIDSVPVVEIKKGLSLRKAGGCLRIIYRRPDCISQSGSICRILFLLISGSLLFLYEFNVISISNYSGITFMEIINSGALLVIGMVLIYRALAMTFDQTEITINPRELSIRHNPLPYPGSPGLAIPLSQIKYIGWRTAFDRGCFRPASEKGMDQPVCLTVIDQDNVSHVILTDIADQKYAELMVKELCGFLHL
jgi:hypothetical protein